MAVAASRLDLDGTHGYVRFCWIGYLLVLNAFFHQIRNPRIPLFFCFSLKAARLPEFSPPRHLSRLPQSAQV
jgi:hypothetical protein